MADFSTLPDVAWVRILSNLPLGDRARVARTCHSLHDAFSHPSLWFTVEIPLQGSLDQFARKRGTVIVPNSYLEMIKRFGKYFQDLTLIIRGFLSSIPQTCRDVLVALADTCRLESLTLEVGSIITRNDQFGHTSREVDMDAIAAVVAKAFRLRRFHLRSWPVYPGLVSVDILLTLKQNEKLRNLEELGLYWESAHRSTWATLNAVVPKPEEFTDTVTHFQNLRSLCLRSTMLSDEAVCELAKSYHRPLERLGILVTYDRNDLTGRGGLPHVTSVSWSRLSEHSPNLQVDITIATRIPYIDLAGFLKPEIPVSSLSFMRYSRCGTIDIQSITDKYQKSLRKFVDYSDGCDCDAELMDMVTRCPKLDYLIYNGKLQAVALLKLAALNGVNWYTFKVNLDNVLTDALDADATATSWLDGGLFETLLDDDTVIKSARDGTFFVSRPPAAYETEEMRDRKIRKIIIEVGHQLGKKWLPMGKHTLEDIQKMHQENSSKVVSQKVYQMLSDGNN